MSDSGVVTAIIAAVAVILSATIPTLLNRRASSIKTLTEQVQAAWKRIDELDKKLDAADDREQTLKDDLESTRTDLRQAREDLRVAKLRIDELEQNQS